MAIKKKPALRIALGGLRRIARRYGCHRTQSGKLHEAMKSLLPDAIFVGFTGTPFLKTDKKQSVEVFGGFIHTYKFNEAVKDGAVRTIKLTCKPNIRANAWRFIGQLQYRNCRHLVESGTRKKTAGMLGIRRRPMNCPICSNAVTMPVLWRIWTTFSQTGKSLSNGLMP